MYPPPHSECPSILTIYKGKYYLPCGLSVCHMGRRIHVTQLAANKLSQGRQEPYLNVCGEEDTCNKTSLVRYYAPDFSTGSQVNRFSYVYTRIHTHTKKNMLKKKTKKTCLHTHSHTHQKKHSHTYIHSYIHTYVYAYIHLYILNIYSYMHTHTDSQTHTRYIHIAYYIHTLTH